MGIKVNSSRKQSSKVRLAKGVNMPKNNSRAVLSELNRINKTILTLLEKMSKLMAEQSALISSFVETDLGKKIQKPLGTKRVVPDFPRNTSVSRDKVKYPILNDLLKKHWKKDHASLDKVFLDFTRAVALPKGFNYYHFGNYLRRLGYTFKTDENIISLRTAKSVIKQPYTKWLNRAKAMTIFKLLGINGRFTIEEIFTVARNQGLLSDDAEEISFYRYLNEHPRYSLEQNRLFNYLPKLQVWELTPLAKKLLKTVK